MKKPYRSTASGEFKEYKKSSGKKPWERSGDASTRPTTMHKATCSACGQQCEVPFRPTGSKPIFCSTCFQKEGGSDTKRPEGARRSADGERRPYKTESRSYDNSRGDSVSEQLKSMNEKLDQILKALR